jgi:hypothetical protein
LRAAGADGYPMKDRSTALPVQAIEKVGAGGKLPTPGVAEQLARAVDSTVSESRHAALSPRETEMFDRHRSGGVGDCRGDVSQREDGKHLPPARARQDEPDEQRANGPLRHPEQVGELSFRPASGNAKSLPAHAAARPPQPVWPRTRKRITLTSNSVFHPPEVKMSHASMLKARRQHQKNKKILDLDAKKAKRLAKQALAGPVVKKEKVKKEKVKKEKVKEEKVKRVKPTKEELGRQDSKKSSAGAGK